MPGYQTTRNYVAYRGDDWIKKFTLINNSDPSYNYAGTTVLMQVKADTEDTVSVLQATPTPDTATLGRAIIDINIPGAQVAAVSPGEYVYDIQYTLPDGRIRTYLKGSFTVTADTSR